MRLIQPSFYHCPEELRGDEKLIMNVLVNGYTRNLGAFTITQIMIYSKLERKRVDDAIKSLAKRNLVKVYTSTPLSIVYE